MDADFIHKEYPKQFAKDDFWRQIKRTVNGQPVSEKEIDLIVDQIETCLGLQPTDSLLDLGCGNGALGSRLFGSIASYLGVDFSRYLLEIANDYFSTHEHVRYIEADIRNVADYAQPNLDINKIVIYGCLSYLSKTDTGKLLVDLHDQLPRLQSIFIGNLPNKQKAEQFFAKRNITDYQLEDPTTPIGVWWNVNELSQLAEDIGFSAHYFEMPPEFYGGDYRLDLLLEC